ncbi:MAG: hemolysin family protein [Bifidobacteriaceae bacterium]|jgi:CBS domain containing-hemolysin-like protein|nr:hemolysin family protein [Bifidobacteriaceae bacterium]
MMSDLIYVLVGLVLTAGTAVFVAAEFALVAVDPATVETAERDGGPLAGRPQRSAAVRRALSRLSTQLSSAQVGITLTTVTLGFTAQPALTRMLTRIADDDGPLAPALTATLAGGVAFVVVNAVSIIGGELAPKGYAIAKPVETAGRLARVQLGFTALVRPLAWVLGASANGILRVFGVRPVEELSGGRSAAELASVVRRSAEAGTLDEALATRLARTLMLRDLRAIDVMTDRTRILAAERNQTAADVVRLARESGHSTFPVTDGSIDEVVGLVRLRRAVAVPHARRGEVPVSALMDRAIRVPETAAAIPVLVDLRASGMPMAIVVDEYGGTSGALTLEDLVEEIVGDVSDEHDPRRPRPRRGADGSWRVPGETRPDELRDMAGIRLPESAAYETLGGLVMAALERIPAAGDDVVADGVRLRVESMEGRRIETLRVWPANDESGPMP